MSAEAKAEILGNWDWNQDAASAPDYSPFLAEVDPLTVIVSGSELVFAQGVARQDSVIGSFVVSASGAASSSTTLLPIVEKRGIAAAESMFDLVFSVPDLSTASLVGLVDTQAIVTGGASVPLLANELFLYDVSNDLLLFQTLTNDEFFSWNGLLDPGIYRLFASADSFAEQWSSPLNARTVVGISSYELEFTLATVPIPESSTVFGAAALGLICGCTWWIRRRARLD
ncbi:MAG: hypothetical protein KF833_20905 [Verrucomicrobiae bacterium]|nr:hypothetical protein [Verrucomicrobiae bacterium]